MEWASYLGGRAAALLHAATLLRVHRVDEAIIAVLENLAVADAIRAAHEANLIQERED